MHLLKLPILQQESAKPKPPAKAVAPSDAELRAQAAESRLSQQVRQARQAQQVPATKAQHAQQAADAATHQAPAQVRLTTVSFGPQHCFVWSYSSAYAIRNGTFVLTGYPHTDVDILLLLGYPFQLFHNLNVV